MTDSEMTEERRQKLIELLDETRREAGQQAYFKEPWDHMFEREWKLLDMHFDHANPERSVYTFDEYVERTKELRERVERERSRYK
jgi:CTP:phosphocholine cytidylyltransferase-like protein